MEKPFSAYRGDEPYIFVCYGHADSAVVYPELRRLHGQGVKIWYDEGISPGGEWTQNIADAIDGAASVLFFVSPSAVKSRHCRNEVQYALDRGKPILSVYLTPTDLPGGLKLSIGSTQALLMYKEAPEGYRRKLDGALRDWMSSPAVLDNPRPSTSKFSSLGLATGILLLIAIGSALWLQKERDSQSSKAADPQPELEVERSVAVLPFRNLSDDPAQEFFSEGLSEDILNELARNSTLMVRPRSSSFLFKGSGDDSQSIGRNLSVTHVLEGTVRRAGTQVRVTAQLIDVQENRPVWSERYDRELRDVFAVQDAITAEILSALSVHLELQSAPRKFVDQEAYDAFLRGRYHFNRGHYGDAERWFAKAIELNPDDAEAWAMRAHVNAYLSSNGVVPNSGANRQLRDSFLQESLSIDPNNVTALAVRALMNTHYIARDYQAALDELARLNRLHPSNEDVLIYMTFVLSTLGEADLVRRVTAHLVRLSPFSANAWGVRVLYGGLLFGPIEQAVLDLSEMARLGLASPVVTAQVALATGESLDVVLATASKDYPPVLFADTRATEAYLRGEFDEAASIVAPFRSVPGYASHLSRMRIALLERNLDQGFASLRSAIEESEPVALSMIRGSVVSRKAFPEFYADPRFELLLREFNLDARSVATIRIPELRFVDR